MGAVVLGKIHLRWCDRCNVPILEQEVCDVCSGNTRSVKLTPPGDARPAFEDDLKRIREMIDSQFGEGAGVRTVPEGRIVLLNKAPDIDRMDEIIMDGEVVGAVRFSLRDGEKFLPRPTSAIAIAERIEKSWVRIDPIAAEAIRENKASTLAVGVLDCDPGIMPRDEVIVLDDSMRPVSVGVSKMSASQMMAHERGTAVKTRWVVEAREATSSGKSSDWSAVVEANKKVINHRVSQAVQFINKTVGENDLPVAVSFSGGKDSHATLMLVLDAGIKPTLIFVDTGLEFDETRANVREVAEEHGLKLVVESAGDSFWDNLPRFGPPAKDFRWCCKTCKLGPATQLIQKNFPKGVLSFIGQRAYESQQRAQKGKIWRNPWTPNQLAASPIQKWTAMHIWLYLMQKGVNVNPLYEMGLERIGCFLCPATDLAELRRVKNLNHEYGRWQQFLNSYAESRGMAKLWLDYDLWRWKKIPKSVTDELGVTEDFCAASSKGGSAEPLEFRSTSGYSPCVEGISMEGVFSRTLPMDRVTNLLNIIGEVTTSPEGNIAEVESITVFQEGPVMIKAKDESSLSKKASTLREVIFKSVECAACGICVARCPSGAMRLDGQIRIDAEKCIHCAKCLGPCPAVRFREDELDI